jgi:beta-xylosidase
VRAYASTDLINWQEPQTIFTAPADLWGDIPIVGIWAPKLHTCQGKYYLFLTFDTRHQLAAQWRNWLPRVAGGSQGIDNTLSGFFLRSRTHAHS